MNNFYDIIMLTKDDWAGTGYRFYKCLKHLGLKVIFFKGQLHHFNYPEQGAIHLAINRGIKCCDFPIVYYVPEIVNLVKQAKIVHFTASTFIDSSVDLTKKKVVVQHGGTTYRLGADKCNEVFNPIADATIIQFPSILNLGAKNEHLIFYPVDTDFIQPDFERKDKKKLIIGHFPSTTEAKGTDIIINTINKLMEEPSFKNRFKYVGVVSNQENVSWIENLWRMNQCDIIIETIQAELWGKPFGSWGNCALEASALGKICITNDNYQDIYKKEYGDYPLYLANSGEELKNQLLKIADYTDKYLFSEKQKFRDWVISYHSIPVTAQRLWSKVYSKLITTRGE